MAKVKKFVKANDLDKFDTLVTELPDLGISATTDEDGDEVYHFNARKVRSILSKLETLVSRYDA